MELVGKLLGNRYEVLEKVGNGGMATVYKAKDKTLNRCVAIKVLKDEFANDQEFIKRFQIEAQSAASLSHPNIVSIYDVANEGELHYIVMELIEGETLKDVIKKEAKLDWKKSVEIASQIASGLSTAHKNHIIHRDIKPHNIIITKDGIAKITDFGIAKAATTSTINANSSSLGSVHYFSPEHARGGYTDEKSDIYSLGVVLYEMVTGKLPFDGDSAVSIAMKHLKDIPVAPKELTPSIPDGLNSIILKAMEKEVSSRYVSANSMYNDLQKLLKDPETKDVGLLSNEDRLSETQRVPHVSRTSGGVTQNTTRIVKTNVNSGGKMENKTTTYKKRTPIKQQHHRTNPIVSFFVGVLLMLLIFGLCIFVGYTIINKMMEPEASGIVPNVVGYNKETAQLLLEKEGFKMEISGAIDSNLPKDYVAKQRYSSGEKLSKGSTVTVNLSAGPKKVLVPNVVGDSEVAARVKLKGSELEVEVQEEDSSEEDVGKIIRQVPEPNTEVDTGSMVTVFIGAGSKIYMPNVLKLNEAQALDVLSKMGLTADVHYITSTEFDDDVVVSQSVEADTEITEGTVVTIVINRFNPPEDEPDAVITPEGHEDEGKPSVTHTPTATPTKGSSGKEEYKYLKVDLKGKGAKSTFVLKVTLNGDIKGRTNIYEGTHSRSEGSVSIPYPADATGMIRVYVDGSLDSEMLITD